MYSLLSYKLDLEYDTKVKIALSQGTQEMSGKNEK